MLQTLHSLRKRTTESEQMDDPSCDDEDLFATLSQFSSLNRFLARYRSILKKYVVEDMQTSYNHFFGGNPFDLKYSNSHMNFFKHLTNFPPELSVTFKIV